MAEGAGLRHPELTFTGTLAQGASARDVGRVQEWLGLHGFRVAIDHDFGPATRRAVAAFQTHAGTGDPAGIVGPVTFAALTAPLARALARLDFTPDTLGGLIVAYAAQHLAESPREIGGENAGPWVRTYTNGLEGPRVPWCAGFVSTILEQAHAHLRRAMPFVRTLSCDTLAMRAKAADLFVDGHQHGAPAQPGWIFLQRRVPGDWTHTGIVITGDADTFETIEGNTNHAGTREGYEVCRRIRGYLEKDFVRIG